MIAYYCTEIPDRDRLTVFILEHTFFPAVAASEVFAAGTIVAIAATTSAEGGS